MVDFFTINDVEVKDKPILLRVDINISVDRKTKHIAESRRIEEATTTIEELVAKGAKVVVIAYQGRAGDYDFLPLDQHAEILRSIFRERFRYVDDTIGVAARKQIASLKSGEVLLLQNFRFLAEETLELNSIEHAHSILVSRLSARKYIH